MSQKQIRDSPDDENSPSNNVQTITVAPTDNSADKNKKCCWKEEHRAAILSISLPPYPYLYLILEEHMFIQIL